MQYRNTVINFCSCIDISRMICTHRSGEPENLAGPLIASTSILGLPTEKALVTEDFIINIAGHRRMTKSNEKYDSCHMPKYAIFNMAFNFVK